MPVFYFSRRIALPLVVFFVFHFLPVTVWAWGNEGHRVTGLVASDLLTAKARIRLNQLVPNANLADIANEMDINKAALAIEIPGSNKWHYDDQPICGNRRYEVYCKNGDCASARIAVYFKILGDSNSTPQARAQAATFLIHLVGDIHHPLHAAEDNDLGGNQKNVLLPNTSMPRNLHRIWDNELVKLTLRGISDVDLAKQLIRRYQVTEIAGWQKGEVRDWLAESQVLSQKVVYGNLPEYVCGEPWPTDKLVSLPQSYVDSAMEVIPIQLAKAGARIAWMLNRALDAAPEPRPVAGVTATPESAKAP